MGLQPCQDCRTCVSCICEHFFRHLCTHFPCGNLHTLFSRHGVFPSYCAQLCTKLVLFGRHCRCLFEKTHVFLHFLFLRFTHVSFTSVGDMVVGAAVVGTIVVGTAVVGAIVVGAEVVGAAVVGPAVVGAVVVGAMLVGAEVVGAAVVGAAVVGTMVVGDGVDVIISQFTTVFPGLNTVLSSQGVSPKTVTALKGVTPGGITTDIMEVPKKAVLPINSNLLLTSNSRTSSGALRNASSRISVTPCGITTDTMEVS